MIRKDVGMASLKTDNNLYSEFCMLLKLQKYIKNCWHRLLCNNTEAVVPQLETANETG